MLQEIGSKLSYWAQRNMPDPFLFSILLTFLTLGLAVLLTETSLLSVLNHWSSAFFSSGILSFGMQMCLILVTGFALATSPPIQFLLKKLSSIPKSTGSATVLISAVSIFTGLINWGLAIVVGALLAREVAIQAYKKGIVMHYPILGAAGYMGLAVWHGGWSGSALLAVSQADHSVAEITGVIALESTLFSGLNLIISLLLLAGIPLLLKALVPTDEEKIISVKDVLAEEHFQDRMVGNEPARREGLAGLLDNSFLITFLIVGMAVAATYSYYLENSKLPLNLNWINFLFLFCGLLFHRSPVAYSKAVSEASSACAGIILQFPFYSGIMGLMKGSGLASLFISGLTSASTGPGSFYCLVFLSASLVNLFVPSGGGQWVIQGPIIMEAAQLLNASYERTLLAFCYGDQWTNLFQPFWALALLGITGLRAAHIMGYCIAIMGVGILFFPLALIFLP